MKILKTLSLSLVLTVVAVNSASLSQASTAVVFSETPVKTVFFKHPLANDATKFFSTERIFNFEIYKITSKEEIAKVIASFEKNADVQSITEGVITGDFHAFTLVLKTVKSKEWFATEFKKAGLNTIKINNNAVVEVDKM